MLVPSISLALENRFQHRKLVTSKLVSEWDGTMIRATPLSVEGKEVRLLVAVLWIFSEAARNAYQQTITDSDSSFYPRARGYWPVRFSSFSLQPATNIFNFS